MRFGIGIGVAMAAAGVLAGAGDALACGGCFAPTETQQVVTDHRMVLAVGATESVLWDQIRYSGSPAEFSWVLPVSGDVTVELGSSLFIDAVDSYTAPVVQAPPPRVVDCGCYYDGDYGGYPNAGGAADAGTARSDGGPPPVTVVSEATVGPYETVTLRSADASALTDWLNSHNYVIPASMQPVIQSYIDQHMDFVALRLLPGEGVSAMQPVKIRYHTASMVLPLRMVGAGVADKVGLSLFVFGLGRHEAANFGNGVIDPNGLTWDWTTNTSDYVPVFARTLAGIDSGRAWITQYADTSVNVGFSLNSVAWQHCQELGDYSYECTQTGAYPNDADAGAGTDAGTSSQAAQDVAAMYADFRLAQGSDTYDTWVTRLRTDLLTRYLDADLVVQPSTANVPVSSLLRATHETGTGPTTCTYHYCGSRDGGSQPAPSVDGGARPGDPYHVTDAGLIRGDAGASSDAGSGGTVVSGGAQCAASPAVGHARGGLMGLLGALGLAAWVSRRRR